MGLVAALDKMGIRHEMSKVGDRYVIEKMIDCGAVIGGEDSGHMIFADCHTTGDGSLTALKLIEAIQLENKPLSELSKLMRPYPQVLINVEIHSKPDIESIPVLPIMTCFTSTRSAASLVSATLSIISISCLAS